MRILGHTLIGQRSFVGSGGTVQAFAAATGEALTPTFGANTLDDVNEACTLAQNAFDPFRSLPDTQRADFLEAIAKGVDELGSTLIDRVHLETGLALQRLIPEHRRTVNQLIMFADLLRSGRWEQAVIDTALPDRKPLPRADIRQRKIGVGPVAVFGSSNFPLAFSVAGGDTASALAAGCPVIVKAHPAHLGTSELVGRVIQLAAKATGMPDGVFSLLIDSHIEMGQALVAHPFIQAVGFTGSRRGGLALVNIAQGRAVPIPVYAEMSSVNPVFLLPGALAERAGSIANAFVESLVVGVGQLCTNPGLLLAVKGPDLEAFVQATAEALAAKPAGTMLSPTIHAAYLHGIDALRNLPGVQQAAVGQAAQDKSHGQPALFRATFANFAAQPKLAEENFGPSAVLVECESVEQLHVALASLEGQLTTTLHIGPGDEASVRALLPLMERKSGRILFNDFPTGVEVNNAMVHGGPYPATSDNRSTSVGSTAIERFLRPVCYQNVPQEFLPSVLHDDNPRAVWRLQNGVPAQD